jgi:hypothetical protein
VESRLLLDVVVAECTSILELFTSEDEPLLVGRDPAYRMHIRFPFIPSSKVLNAPFLILDFCLDIVDGIGRLHLEGDGLPCKGLDEDLHLQRVSA